MFGGPGATDKGRPLLALASAEASRDASSAHASTAASSRARSLVFDAGLRDGSFGSCAVVGSFGRGRVGAFGDELRVPRRSAAPFPTSPLQEAGGGPPHTCWNFAACARGDSGASPVSAFGWPGGRRRLHLDAPATLAGRIPVRVSGGGLAVSPAAFPIGTGGGRGGARCAAMGTFFGAGVPGDFGRSASAVAFGGGLGIDDALLIGGRGAAEHGRACSHILRP